jgi:hypothetical protein
LSLAGAALVLEELLISAGRGLTLPEKLIDLESSPVKKLKLNDGTAREVVKPPSMLKDFSIN